MFGTAWQIRLIAADLEIEAAGLPLKARAELAAEQLGVEEGGRSLRATVARLSEELGIDWT